MAFSTALVSSGLSGFVFGSKRAILNAIFYLVRSGCAWRMLPNDLPLWSAVLQQIWRWVRAGCFEAMAHDLRVLVRVATGTTRNWDELQALVQKQTGRTLQPIREWGGPERFRPLLDAFDGFVAQQQGFIGKKA